jgi:hypothetical protein
LLSYAPPPSLSAHPSSPPPFTQPSFQNKKVTDYVPRGAARGAARLVVAASSFVIYLGAMKLNLGGKGVGGALRSLWT